MLVPDFFEIFEISKSLFVGRGFAHGFQTLEKNTEVLYHIDEFYSPDHSSGILWNDEKLKINWPLSTKIMSDKDKNWKKI